MKFLLFASFVVLCSASALYGTKKISIGENGGVVLQANNGKKIMITKQTGMSGERFIEITIFGPKMGTKKIRINDDDESGMDSDYWKKNWSSEEQSGEDYRYKRGFKHVKFTQGDLVINILKQHQGNIDDVTYLQLLNQIDQAVKRGQINQIVLNLLENLNTDLPFDSDPLIVRHIQEAIIPTQGQNDILSNVATISPVVSHLNSMNTLRTLQAVCGVQPDINCLIKLKLGMVGIPSVYGTSTGLGAVTNPFVNPMFGHHLLGVGSDFSTRPDSLLDQLDDAVTVQQVLRGVAGVSGISGVPVGLQNGVVGGIVPLNSRWNMWQNVGRTPYLIKRLMQQQQGLNDVLVNELYKQNLYGGKYVDAVYAAAHAIHNIILDECGTDPFYLCEDLKPAPLGPQLLKYLRNVSFVGRQRTEVKFNTDGDAYGSYNIYQYQRHQDGKYDYNLIGSWKELLRLNVSRLKFKGLDTIPKSICSDACPSGHIRNFQDQCCWVCVSCREDAYVFNDTCKSCLPGFAPNNDKTDCDKLKALVIDWLSPWAMVPLVFSSFGIFCTLFTMCVFIRYNRTPVIMASGRELCYVLLSGVLCCYSMSFIILAKPTVETCAVMRIGLGLCLSVCYSAIFTKTNRISRIFNRGVKSIKRPVYTSPISQVAIALGIVSIQLFGSIAWLVIERPDIREIYPYPLTAVLTCRVSTFSLIMSLVYNMILIILCTWYAFKTRKIPENFNEAKYIGFTMYSTCIVWLAFLPIYFGTNNDYKIQIVSMCMCLNISATVALGCLFTPKVYLVIFQPYKNVRQTNGNQGVTQERPAYSMRFACPRSQTVQSMTSNSKSSPRFGHKHANGDPNALPSPSIEESSLS